MPRVNVTTRRRTHMSGKYKIITPSGKVIEGTRPQVIADKAFAAETQDVHEGRHKRRAYDEGNRLVDRALAARQDVYVANAAVIEANDRFRELLDAEEPSHD